jgi:methylglutaconyl-CoA hydratase
VRIIVLRGNGKHFSAGAAIGECGHPRRAIGDVCALVDAAPKPTIAVTQGACIGGALALASCCDIMIAGREAMFSIPEVRLGFAPGPLIGVFARAIGYRALRRYLLSGERFSAEEGHRLGLVQQLCDTSAIDSVADDMIDELLLGAPGAAATAKRLLQKQALASPSPEELREMQAAFETMAKSDEAAEGRAAFKEKRKPHWYLPR